MALKEIFHVVAAEYPTGADTNATIASGMGVVMNATGNIGLPNLQADMPLGLAGDTISAAFTATVNNPESANLVIGSWATQTSGNTRWTQNRVADNYDETLASGLMTVYHGGGEFYSDQYDTVTDAGAAVAWVNGAPLYVNWGTATTTAGYLTSDATTKTYIFGLLIEHPAALPSGVPGTDVQGSISFGTFIRFRLDV